MDTSHRTMTNNTKYTHQKSKQIINTYATIETVGEPRCLQSESSSFFLSPVKITLCNVKIPPRFSNS